MSQQFPRQQRFRSLSTTLPDAGGTKGFDVPFSVFSSFDPIDEDDEVEEELQTDAHSEDDLQKKLQAISKRKSGPERPVERFRRIARSIMNQNRWTARMQKLVVDEDQVKQLKLLEGDQVDILTFNPGAFSAATNTRNELSFTAKMLFTKSSLRRSAEDLECMYKVVDSLTAFKKFPSLVKKELTKSLYYEQFDDGRIIIQQGHIGFSLYFVVKGSVAVEVSTIDKKTGKIYRQIVTEIMAGGSFGEMALLKGTVREATVICRGRSEFLRIDKEDFQQVLMRSHAQETQRKIACMKKSPIFSGWFFKELRAISSSSCLVVHENNDVIVPDLQSHVGSIFIILSGKCQVVAKVSVVRETLPFGKDRLTMLTRAQVGRILLGRFQTLEELFLVIRELDPESCFGIGESLPNTSVVACGKVEVLSVPTVHILRHGQGNSLEKVRTAEMQKYPSIRDAFKNFLAQRKWKEFKEKIKSEIFAKRQNSTSPTFRSSAPNTSVRPPLTGKHANHKKSQKKKRLTPDLSPEDIAKVCGRRRRNATLLIN